MTISMQQTQADTEVWLNTSAGVRWYKCLDLYGRETSKLVRGGKTFTVTTFERQLNQEAVASTEQDLFRNGTFVLRKEAETTNPEEIRSPNSLTDAEVTGVVTELIHGKDNADVVLAGYDSPVTLGRIHEALVLEDAPKDVIAAVKGKITALAPKKSGNNPASEPVMTKPDEFDEAPGEPVTAEVKEPKKS